VQIRVPEDMVEFHQPLAEGFIQSVAFSFQLAVMGSNCQEKAHPRLVKMAGVIFFAA